MTMPGKDIEQPEDEAAAVPAPVALVIDDVTIIVTPTIEAPC